VIGGLGRGASARGTDGVTRVHAHVHGILGRMVALQIRDVPTDIRDDLAREAEARGVSLQAYLREVVDREAKAARNREFLRTMTPVPVTGVAAEDVTAALAESRRERDEQIADAIRPGCRR
jgi:hypothetical protein